MSELFDIACNFSSNRYDNDLDEVIKNAKNNNVTKFLVVSASINDVDKVIRFTKNIDRIVFLQLAHTLIMLMKLIQNQ